MPRSPTETIRFLTLDETARLLHAIGAHRRDRALFLIAYRHGLRASEVGLLRVEDLDLKTLRIMVHRLKGSHSGAHPLQPDEAKAPQGPVARAAGPVSDPVPEQPRRSDRPAHARLADEEVWVISNKGTKRDTGDHQDIVLIRFLLGNADPACRQGHGRLEAGQVCPDKQVFVGIARIATDRARNGLVSSTTNPEKSFSELNRYCSVCRGSAMALLSLRMLK